MRLSMLPIVNRTVDALRQVELDIASIELGCFEIAIGGQGGHGLRYADRALCDVAKAVLLAELAGRKLSLEQDLESYGVTLQAVSPSKDIVAS